MTTVTEKPKEALKLYTFKPTPFTKSLDEMETVIAESLTKAIEKNPKMLRWYLHSVTK